MIAEKVTISWTYDNLNRLLGETYNAPGTNDDYTHSYTYNLVNNRLTKSVAGAGTTYYQYNNKDQLLKESPNADYSNPNFTYQYDDNGSMTHQVDNYGLVFAYGYNLQNKLETMTLDGEELARYEYNPDGIRVKAIQEGVTTNYLIDAYNHTGYSQVFKETRNTSPETRTAYIIGSTVLAQSNGTTLDLRSLLRDGHGSVRQLSDYIGLVAGQVFNYDAYGNVVNYVTPETNLLYTGEYLDWYIGGYNLRSRDSRPDLGIFMTEDTYAGNRYDPMSLNKYTYCSNNPVNRIDPSGKVSIGEQVYVTAIAMVLMSANISNAPGPSEVTFRDNSGEMIIDAAYWLAGDLAIRTVIAPVAQTTFRYLRFGYRGSGAGLGKWIKVTENMSSRAAQYQTQITGRAIEDGYLLNGVKFDGFKPGKLLDAKGPGYKNFVKDGEFADWFTGKSALVDQAEHQVAAAKGVKIEWHFAEEETLKAAEKLLAEKPVKGITLIYTPPQ